MTAELRNWLSRKRDLCTKIITPGVVLLIAFGTLWPQPTPQRLPKTGSAPSAAEAMDAVVDLDTFGALGDSSDDTDRFRAAIQSLGRFGGTLRIQNRGTYLISSPLVLDGRLSIRLDCDAGSSRASADTQTINIVYTGATGSLITAHGIRGLEIDHCKDGTGGRLKVIGSSIAIVTVGPIPGSTPMNVPTKTPVKQ